MERIYASTNHQRIMHFIKGLCRMTYPKHRMEGLISTPVVELTLYCSRRTLPLRNMKLTYDSPPADFNNSIMADLFAPSASAKGCSTIESSVRRTAIHTSINETRSGYFKDYCPFHSNSNE